MQAGIANGSEPTFDGQPMQIGTHLRWAFAPELGFPPGAFWLFRRSLRESRCGPDAPPVQVSEAIERQRAAGPASGADGGMAAPGPVSAPDPQGLGSTVSFSTANSVSTAAGAAPGRGCGECCCCRALPATQMAAASLQDTARADPADETGAAAACGCCGRCRPGRQPEVNIQVTICCCCASAGGSVP